MKWKHVLSLVQFLLIFSSLPLPAYAQAALDCGAVIQGELRDGDQIQEYKINIVTTDKLVIVVEATDPYSSLLLDIGLNKPNGDAIAYLRYDSPARIRRIEASQLPNGNYTLAVRSAPDTSGAYIVSIGCLKGDGTVVSGNRFTSDASCGVIHKNEFIRDEEELHIYYISLNTIDKLKVTVEATDLYSSLLLDIGLNKPNGDAIAYLRYDSPAAIRVIETSGLPNGIYTLYVRNKLDTNGPYTLSIGCERNGTVINPGDTPSAGSSSGTSGDLSPAPIFSGIGFPGLAPVDFANAAKLPLPPGIAMSGGITPTGGEILGYTLDAAAGDTLDLTFTRLSGNLNLGLVVLSADNKVVFQASLVTSTTLNTRFTLPSSGQYTIGVFRIDLLPPAAPEATAFQVQGTLIP